MAIKTFTTGEVLTAADTNTYLANSGLVYVTKATVGTGVSSVTVTNAFNSTYDNYKIVMSSGVGSTAQSMAFQFGPSSVTGYNTNYNYVLDIRTYAAGASTIINSATDTQWTYVGESGANINQIDIDVLTPNLAKWSIYNGGYIGTNNSGTTAGIHKNAFAYSDFKISVAGTLTGGEITVYGYRKG
jgi:hypothetical protein